MSEFNSILNLLGKEGKVGKTEDKGDAQAAVAVEEPPEEAPAALPSRLNRVADCPYCGKTFPLRAMEFLLSNGENPFTPIVSEEKETDTKTEFTGRSRTNTSLSAEDAAPAAEIDDRKSMPETQEYGVSNAVDVIGYRFMRSYGEGVIFRFNRRGTFYKIGTREQARRDHRYGFIDEDNPGSWDGDAPQQLCVYVDDETTQRITSRLCPHCHCDLPAGYYACPPERKHIIVLAGGSSSGKTQFITFAMHCLSEELGTLDLGSARLESCSDWFRDLYLKQIKRQEAVSRAKEGEGSDAKKDKHSGPDATKKEYSLLPFLISVTPRGGERAFVTIHDVPGEYATNDNVAVNKECFQQAELILLMIDSSYLFSTYAEIGNALQCKQEPKSALSVFKQYTLCPNCKGIIAVLTKIDTIINVKEGARPIIHGDMEGLHNGMYLYKHDMLVHRGAVNRYILRRIDEEISTRVLSIVRAQMRQDLADTFDVSGSATPISFLGVSTLVNRDGEFSLDPDATGGRHRLIEPLLKAFADLGILPAKDEEPEGPAEPEEEEEERPGFLKRLFRRR